MNNATITTENVVFEEIKKDSSPLLRERAEILSDVIEALQNIGGSSHWQVLQKYVFDVDLEKAKRSLVNSKDTTEMFRLQGEIRFGEKFSIENLILKYRNELLAIKKQLHE